MLRKSLSTWREATRGLLSEANMAEGLIYPPAAVYGFLAPNSLHVYVIIHGHCCEEVTYAA